MESIHDQRKKVIFTPNATRAHVMFFYNAMIFKYQRISVKKSLFTLLEWDQ